MSNIIRQTTFSGEPFILEYFHHIGRKKGFPASATFEITPRCNFNCKMCYIHSCDNCSVENEELSAEKWIDIARQGRDMGIIFALITGGEPLIRNDFPYIYTEMKKLGILISVNTNGSLISGDLARLFIENPPTRLNISLYGANEKTYTDLCGVSAFGKVYNNIRMLAEAGIQLRLNMSITPLNCGDLEQMVNIAKELGVHSKATTYMYPPVRRESGLIVKNPARFTADQAAFYRAKYDLLRLGKDEFIRRAEKLENEFQNHTECCDLEQIEEKMRCRAGTSSCWVNYRGEMTACGMFPNGGYNILEMGFPNAWKFVQESTKQIHTPAECVTCKNRNLCPMCAAVCISETGSYCKVPDYACEFSISSEKYIRELAKGICK